LSEAKMKKDTKYAAALLTLEVHSSIAVRQAQGHLAREFGIILKTAAKATDRLFNGTTDRNENPVAPYLELSACKTKFVNIDRDAWIVARERFSAKSKAQEEGVLTHLSSARHNRKMKALSAAAAN
jgi:hypothetical protein